MKKNQIKIDKFELLVLISGAFSIGILVEKIAINGISWISTTGLLG